MIHQDDSEYSTRSFLADISVVLLQKFEDDVELQDFLDRLEAQIRSGRGTQPQDPQHRLDNKFHLLQVLANYIRAGYTGA